jgi:hypothetical protein
MVARLPLVTAVGAALCAAVPARADGPPDPTPLYGSEIVFSVMRKGSEIGQHRVLFTREDGALVVRSLLDLAVKFLGVTVYRYKYSAREVWRDGKLMLLESAVNDDGKAAKVEAEAEAGKIAVSGPAGRALIVPPILPSTHWDPQVIGAGRLLNTLDGKIDRIRLVPEGTDSVPVGTGSREATHYVWTGDIKAESWYDAAGHWLKLRFNGKDGTPIDYVCKRCMAAP